MRQHLRQRGFALTVLFTLALTVGATTAVVSVVNAVLVRSLPFSSPERLVWIASVRPDNPNAPFTLPEFIDYRSQTRTLSGLAAYANWSANLAGTTQTERLQGARMSANIFDVLGITAAIGRLLTDADDRADAPAVVVISYRLWRSQFGGNADVVGRSVRINTDSFVIVGVLPPVFPLPLRDIDVITPLVADRDPLRHARGSVNFLRFVGRLRDGVAAAEAQAELTTICRSLRQQFPVEYARKDAVRIDALHDAVVGDFRQSMFLLVAAVIVVLATAIGNLLSLALVRANARRAELSIRIALGATPWHLGRQLTLETLLLVVAGSTLGCLLASRLIAVAILWAPPSIPRLNEVSLDRAVALLVVATIAAVTTVLAVGQFATVTGTRVGDTLRQVSYRAIGDRWNVRVRNVLVVAEIAASLVLCVATLVLVDNLVRLQNVDLGFNPDGVFQARVSLPPTYRSTDDVARFYERLSERIVASPGVGQMGVISIAPLSGLLATVPFSLEGEADAASDKPNVNLRAISPGYPATAGTRLVRGRMLAESDGSNSPSVGLVSAALADRFLSGDGVARRLLINDNNTGPRPIEIVGVLEDVRQTALDTPASLDLYIPLRQVHADGVAFLRNNQFWMVKTVSDPATFRSTFLAHLRAVDVDAAVSGMGTMRQFVDDWLGPRRFNLGLFGAFALSAALLAVSGLYGLVSYAVSQRSREIGLRMAIGATQGQVQQMVLGQAARLGVAGAALGVAVVVTLRPFVARTVQDATLAPAMLTVITALLMVVVLMAAWLPARRAARTHPTVALKA